MAKPIPKLRHIFTTLNERGISYCHWKSNEHLCAALVGKTDLDILVVPKEVELLRGVLRDTRCKRLYSARDAQHPEREDWLGFDEETGEQFHIDLHTGIVIGPRELKVYNLPITEWLLEGTTLQDGVRVPPPSKELALLIVRILLKGAPFEKSMKREMDWLLERADAPTAIPIEGVTEVVVDFLKRYRNNTQFFNLSSALHHSLRPYYRSSRFERWYARLSFFLRNKLHVRRTRYARKPAVFFAIVGADGSGKTTITESIVKWLGWKVSVVHLYFGSPRNSRLVRFFSFLRARVSLSITDSWYWLAVVWVRYRQYVRARRFSARGVMVIAERYPLRAFWDMRQPMDGPRIPTWRVSSKIERWLYGRIGMPDTIIVLKTPLDILKERKTEKRIDEKAQAIEALVGTPFVPVRTDVPQEETLREVKRIVWNSI
ncbi:MAG: hypothetical protein Q8Q18_03500 [bacterium]|nr:hypothetical protein [bacterium]